MTGWKRTVLVFLPAIPLGLLALGSNEACVKHETVTSDAPIIIGATVDLTKQKDFGNATMMQTRKSVMAKALVLSLPRLCMPGLLTLHTLCARN